MSFKDQPFSHRFAKLGDEAEAKFTEVWGKPFVRFGLDRPPLHVPSLPERVRHMPDFLCSAGFVECKGLGRDQIFKIKVVEFSCGQFWNQLHPLTYFLWDSHKKRHTDFTMKQLNQWINDGHATLASFPEGRAYFALPASVVFGG